MNHVTKDIVNETIAKEIGWSLLRSAYMNCWGACSSLAEKDIDTADGGIDAFNKAESEKEMQEQDEQFAFATGLETSVDPIVTARQWMGVVETLYPMMNVNDRLHPLEFIKERLEEPPEFDMSDNDIRMRMNITGMSQEAILNEFREKSQAAWDKKSAIRERTADVFKSIGSTEEAPVDLLEKIDSFASRRATQAATDSWIERGNETLANVALIKEEIKAAENTVTH